MVEESAHSEHSKLGGDRIVDRHGGLFSRTLLVSGLTLLSRILGFVREALSAFLFGDSSSVYDAFVTAWRVPNLFRRLLGEGALSTALQTEVTAADAASSSSEDSDAGGRAVFWSTMRVASVLLLVVCALVMFAAHYAPDQLPVLGWNWLGDDPEPVRDLIVRLMPFVVLICLAALVGGALQVRGHFSSPAWAPVVLNTVWIGSLIAVGLTFGWYANLDDGVSLREHHWEMARFLAWGVLLAGVAQLVVQLPALKRFGLARKAAEPVKTSSSKAASGWSVLKKSLPLAIGAAVYQINVMVDGLMAESLLPTGGPVTFYYANRIQQLPMALVAIAATSAVFPRLQALGVRGALSELRDLHRSTHLAISFIALPASAGLFVLAEPITSELLGHGAFSHEGVLRTASALRAFAFSLVPAGAVGLASRTYFALGDFRRPVKVSCVVLVLNVVLNLVLVRTLGMDVDGLAWATVISVWLQLALLLPGLVKRLPKQQSTSETKDSLVPRVLMQLLLALAVGLAAAATQTLLPAGLLNLSLAIAVGGLVFLAGAKLMKLPEWQRLEARFKRG